MKTIIPINTDKGGVSRTIRANYHKAGWSDFAFDCPMPYTGVMEIEYGTESDTDRELSGK